MARYRRSFLARSNRGKFGEVLLHNLLAGQTKSEKQQEERVKRVAILLKKYELADLNPRAILDYARDHSISIDQIEKKVLFPEIRRRQKLAWDLQRMSKADRQALAIMSFFERTKYFWVALIFLVAWYFDFFQKK